MERLNFALSGPGGEGGDSAPSGGAESRGRGVCGGHHVGTEDEPVCQPAGFAGQSGNRPHLPAREHQPGEQAHALSEV